LAWTKAVTLRYGTAYRECQQFAVAQRFPFIASEEVVVVLMEAVEQRLAQASGTLPEDATEDTEEDGDSTFTLYLNPLADRNLKAPVAPGHILVDLTYAHTMT
jgi:hypothetical protein